MLSSTRLIAFCVVIIATASGDDLPPIPDPPGLATVSMDDMPPIPDPPGPELPTIPPPSKDPWHLHYWEPERNITDVIGAAYDAEHGVYRFLYTVGADGIAQATTKDFINWNRETVMAMKPDTGCTIEGGSIFNIEKDHHMYYSQKCCVGSECTSSVYYALSLRGYPFMKLEEPVLKDVGLVAPSVLYVDSMKKYVMTLAQPEGTTGGSKPTFYTSLNGRHWEKVGELSPPEGFSFTAGLSTHLLQLDDQWLLMGTIGTGKSVTPQFLTGSLKDDGMFEVSSDSKGQFIAWVKEVHSPAPVRGHPDNDTYVFAMYSQLTSGNGFYLDLKEALTFPLKVTTYTKPLTGGVRSSLYLNVEFPSALDALLWETSPGEEKVIGSATHLHPSPPHPEGLYRFKGSISTTSTMSAAIVYQMADYDPIHEAKCVVDAEKYENGYAWEYEGGQIESLHELPLPVGADKVTEFTFYLDARNAEINTNGFGTHFSSYVNAYCTHLKMWTGYDTLKLMEGWDFVPVNNPELVGGPVLPSELLPGMEIPEIDVPAGASRFLPGAAIGAVLFACWVM